jgi:hypothetical protein
MRAVFTLLLTTTFAFLAAVVVGGAAPSLVVAAVSFSIAGALLVLGHWLHLPTFLPSQE